MRQRQAPRLAASRTTPGGAAVSPESGTPGTGAPRGPAQSCHYLDGIFTLHAPLSHGRGLGRLNRIGFRVL
eukprot:327541-Hanusia_phi.AAC.1